MCIDGFKPHRYLFVFVYACVCIGLCMCVQYATTFIQDGLQKDTLLAASQTIIAQKLRKFNAVSYVHIVSQNIRHLIFYNLKKPGPIFVIFSVQYPELL